MQRAIAAAVVLLTLASLFVAVDASTANETIKYVYDARGRLIRVERTGTVNNNVKATYTLDKAGNRINVTVTGK